MVLSGTYLDRLIFRIFPMTTMVILIYYLVNSYFNLFLYIAFPIIIWFFDCIIIAVKYRNLKTLKIENGLQFNSEHISPDEIKRIAKIDDQGMRWTHYLIEFTFNNGRSFIVMDKPKFFFSVGTKTSSKTLKLLFDEYPELEKTLKPTRGN